MLVFTPENIEEILRTGLKQIVDYKRYRTDHQEEYDIKNLLASSTNLYQEIIKDEEKYSQLGAIGVVLISAEIAKYLELEYLGPDGFRTSKVEVSVSEQYIQRQYKNYVWRAIKCATGMVRHITVEYGFDYNYNEIINDIIAGIVYRDTNDKKAFDALSCTHDEYDSDTEIKNAQYVEDSYYHYERT